MIIKRIIVNIINFLHNVKKEDFRSIAKTIYFNFHYLPFRQAIHLPILLYKPDFKSLGGDIKINGEARYGMIKLGYPLVSLYKNDGIALSINGSIVFQGSAFIGHCSAIYVGQNALLVIGDKFRATAQMKLSCAYKIRFGESVSVGWECLFTDTDWHRLTKNDGSTTKGYAMIDIGSYCWFACKCCITKGCVLPQKTTVSAGSVIGGKFNIPEKCVIGNSKDVVILKTGVWKDPKNNSIDFSLPLD